MTTNHLGGSYLKPGMLKANADVRCTLRAGSRIVEGKFGPALELPLTIEDQQFVLSVPADKGDGQAIQVVFGPVGPSYDGKAVRVWESAILERVRVSPVG